MTCSDFLDAFSDYVDGGASSALCAETDRHLEDCPGCRRYLEVFERGRALLRSFPEVEVSDDFRPRLQHRIYHIEDGTPLARSASGSATTAATVLGMAVLLVFAAWSPVLLARETVVDMSPIVVTRPAPRAMGIRPAGAASFLEGASRLSTDMDRLPAANALLFQYSPLAERLNRPRIRRAGLD